MCGIVVGGKIAFMPRIMPVLAVLAFWAEGLMQHNYGEEELGLQSATVVLKGGTIYGYIIIWVIRICSKNRILRQSL